MRIKIIAAALSLIGVMLTPVAAIAACPQADLTGTWQIYSSGWNGIAYWARCRIVVNAAGNIAPSTCVFSNGVVNTVGSGNLRMTSPAACTFTGYLTVGGVFNRIRHGTLARDKNTANAVGTFYRGTFIFSMTKI